MQVTNNSEGRGMLWTNLPLIICYNLVIDLNIMRVGNSRPIFKHNLQFFPFFSEINLRI